MSPSRSAFLRASLRGSADRFSFFPVRFLGRLFVKFPTFHLAKNAFALHFLPPLPGAEDLLVFAHRRRKGESTAAGSIAVGPHDVALSTDGAVSGLHRAAVLSGGWIDPGM
jgi:hypothetical protein